MVHLLVLLTVFSWLYTASSREIIAELETTQQLNISTCEQGGDGLNSNTLCITATQCTILKRTWVRSYKNNTCSWIVYTVPETDEIISIEYERPSASQVWGCGLASVAIISLSGLTGGLLWPIINSELYTQVMRILIGLALGCLTATSIFQLIPEGFQITEQRSINTSVIMWGSIWVLYMFEVIFKIMLHTEKNHHHTEKQSGPLKAQNGTLGKHSESRLYQLSHQGGIYGSSDLKMVFANPKPFYTSQNTLPTTVLEAPNDHKSHGKISMVAYVVLFGDALHNFIDGMSIGAGYSKDLSSGISMSIAIACEEFPHELGDFAILLNSGMPLKKALLYNFMSACTAFAGLILGILIGELETNKYIFAFAGGLFLYVSLSNLMPELNNMIDQELKKGQLQPLYALFLQNIGILMGFSVLYIITKYPIEIS